MVIVCPGFKLASSPPGDSEIYLPPSRLSLVIAAPLSFGNCTSSCTVSDTLAWKVFGSITSSVTLPTLTPAIFTSAPTASPSI